MPQIAHPHSPPGVLRRQVGLVGAVLLGLGSILGTGVFVSLALGVGLVGDGIVLAVACAALVALANGMSSAQLAANHPVSGGTYEYGYRWLSPRLGFAAGFLFLCAKAASAATAARGPCSKPPPWNAATKSPLSNSVSPFQSPVSQVELPATPSSY